MHFVTYFCKKSNGKIIFLIEGDLYFKSKDLKTDSTVKFGMNFTDQLTKYLENTNLKL